MFKVGICQAQKVQIKANVPQCNRTPNKNRSPITRSPIKDRRNRSPFSKSPIRKQNKQHLSPVYNPPYVKINYLNVKSPTKERTPLKDIKDNFITNTEQARKFRQQQSKYSPYKIVAQEPLLKRVQSVKCMEEREFKLKNYQLFNKAVQQVKDSAKKGSNRKEMMGDSGKRHPLMAKVEEVKFIAVNYFNVDPQPTKIHKTRKENVVNMHHFNQMKKPVEKFIVKQFAEQEAEKNKPIIKESQAHFDRVMMSFDPQLNDTQLNMDPFL